MTLYVYGRQVSSSRPTRAGHIRFMFDLWRAYLRYPVDRFDWRPMP
jgi:hypothetical protein